MKPYLYALSTCFHCQRTKRWLAEHQIEYDYVDVDLTEGDNRRTLVQEVQELTGASQFPVIKMGDKFVVGFHEERLKELLGM